MQVDRLRLYTNNLNKNILDKAIQDAYRAYQDKYKEGYTDENGASFELPETQKAVTYGMPGQEGKANLTDKHFVRGIAVQAKLDGIRGRAWNTNGEIMIYSNEGNLFPWL